MRTKTWSSSRRSRVIAAGVVLWAVVLTACGATTMPPILVGRAADAPSPVLLERLVQAARERGYEPLTVDAEHGRFAIAPRGIRVRNGHTILVECFADGLVLISPVGPDVERRRRHYVLPRALREEILELSEALGQAARARYRSG